MASGPQLVGPGGENLSNAGPQVGLKMPWIASIQITAMIQANNEAEAKSGLHRLVHISLPLAPHLLEVAMDASPMPPEMLAQILAQQKGMKP